MIYASASGARSTNRIILPSKKSFQRFRALRSTDESDVMVTDLMDEAPLAQAQAEVMGYNLHATLE